MVHGLIPNSKEDAMDRDERPDDGPVNYKSPRHVQVLFLRQSRRKWKTKCGELRVEQKRLSNRVRDVTKSREEWKEQAKAEAARAKELEAEVAALRMSVADLKKGATESRHR
jgi:hypothetical protein